MFVILKINDLTKAKITVDGGPAKIHHTEDMADRALESAVKGDPDGVYAIATIGVHYTGVTRLIPTENFGGEGGEHDVG